MPSFMPSLQAALLTSLAMAGVPAAAQVTAPAAPAASASPAQAPMSFVQMIDHLTRLGYRDLKEIERESERLYEVEARDPQGAWVEIHVDARSGEVLRTKPKRKD